MFEESLSFSLTCLGSLNWMTQLYFEKTVIIRRSFCLVPYLGNLSDFPPLALGSLAALALSLNLNSGSSFVLFQWKLDCHVQATS